MVAPDPKFTVTNSRNGFSKTYTAPEGFAFAGMAQR